MSSFCPLSSCKETERKVKGSRVGLISFSGRLVTQMRRFGDFESTRSSRNPKTWSRWDGRDVFGHSSKASTTRYIGACPGTSKKSLRHRVSSSFPGIRAPSLCRIKRGKYGIVRKLSRRTIQGITYQSTLFPAPAMKGIAHQFCERLSNGWQTNVSHVSRVTNSVQMFSIRRTCYC